jgi:hypothetical protein
MAQLLLSTNIDSHSLESLGITFTHPETNAVLYDSANPDNGLFLYEEINNVNVLNELSAAILSNDIILKETPGGAALLSTDVGGAVKNDEAEQYPFIQDNNANADPTGSVVPDAIGSIIIDTTNDKIYQAVGATSADWKETTFGDSSPTVGATLSSWILDTGNIYYADVVHNFNSDDVFVEIFDSLTKENVLVEKIDRIDLNTVRIFVSGNTASLRVVVIDGFPKSTSESGRNVVSNPATPYTAQNNDIILWNTSTGNKVLTLPNPATSNSFRIDIKKTDNSSNTITLDASTNGGLIEDANTALITIQYEAVSVVCDGGNWWILASL